MKKMIKSFSFIMVILVFVSVFSLNAFGFSNNYMTIECPENFDEYDYSTDGGFYVDVFYDEYALDVNGEEYYTNNTLSIYATSCWGDTLETYYDEATLDSLVELTEGGGNQITSKTMYYATFGGYDAVVYDVYYTYTGADEEGKRVVEDYLCSEVIVVTDRTCITMDFDISDDTDLLVYRNEMAEKFLKGMSFNAEAIADAEKREKTILAVVLTVVIGGVTVGLISIIALIVYSTKQSKKNRLHNKQLTYNSEQPQLFNPYENMVPQANAIQEPEKTEENTSEYK